MKITEEEIRLLAKVARNYPKGYGPTYVPGFSNSRVSREGFFLEHPEVVEKGWPLNDLSENPILVADKLEALLPKEMRGYSVPEPPESPEKSETWRDRPPLL